MEKLKHVLNKHGNTRFPTTDDGKVVFFLDILLLKGEKNKLRASVLKGKAAGKDTSHHEKTIFFDGCISSIRYFFPKINWIKINRTTAIFEIPGREFIPGEKKKRGRKKSNLNTIRFTNKELIFLLDNPFLSDPIKKKLKT